MHEVLQTFRAAVERLDEDPDLRFAASSASYYRWVKETSPDLFARIGDLVRDGRWVITGGQWVEPDCNLPSGESVCRQFLYGQRFLAEHLGVTATVGYNVDSFGHSGTLPQLLAASGLGSYVFMRPGPDEKPIASPAFRWRGTDGTDVAAYRIPYDYSTRGGPEDEVIRKRAGELLARSAELGIPLMAFFGVGDHGGGPTRLALRTIHALADEHGGAVAFGDPASYFRALEHAPGGARELPTVSGELQWHAVGCYSARADLKLANGRAEDALGGAEILNEVCRLLTGGRTRCPPRAVGGLAGCPLRAVPRCPRWHVHGPCHRGRPRAPGLWSGPGRAGGDPGRAPPRGARRHLGRGRRDGRGHRERDRRPAGAHDRLQSPLVAGDGRRLASTPHRRRDGRGRATRPRAADPLGRGDLQPDPQPPPGHRPCPRLPQVLAPCHRPGRGRPGAGGGTRDRHGGRHPGQRARPSGGRHGHGPAGPDGGGRAGSAGRGGGSGRRGATGARRRRQRHLVPRRRSLCR